MTPSTLDSRARLLLERGERDAAAALVIERMTPGILGYLRTQLIEEDAQDALSLWREAIWTSLATFEWRSSVRAWAFRIARHVAARVRRRPHRKHEEPLPSSAASRLPASSGASSSGRHLGLATLRAELDAEDQELLTLRVDRELEWEEIAVVLDGTSVALRKRFERLTRKLEKLARERRLLD